MIFFWLWKWGFCFRVKNFGIHVMHVKSMSDYHPLFSERYGYRKAYYFFGWRFEFVKPR
jgi:hypothetical protein